MNKLYTLTFLFCFSFLYSQKKELKLAQKLYRQEKVSVQQPEDSGQTIQQPEPQQQQAAEPDPKAKAWADKNDWFGQDEVMTYAAFGIHRKLVEEEGNGGKG